MEQESKMSTDETPLAVKNMKNNSHEDTGGMEEIKYSSVSIKPTKTNKTSALARIKTIQENDWKTWLGPDTKYSGRPGTGGIVKIRTRKDPDKKQVEDDLRFNNLLKII